MDYQIRDLPDEETSPADDDFLAIDDVSGTKLKKITKSNLLQDHNDLGGLNDGDYKHLTATEKTLFDTIESGADVTDAINIASSINGVANKATPINADKVPLIDTANGNKLKTSTWTNIKAFLKTYFDTLYNKYVHPNHSGEVISAADGAQTITNKAVTLAKMADMVTASLLGRNTAATGVPEVLSKATALSLLNVADGADVTEDNKAADSSLLNNAVESVSAGNNTIVKRHASGYIYVNYLNTTANDVASGVTKVMVETGNDSFIRHGSAAAIALFVQGSIKLDNLAAPDDNTDLDASTSKHGLLKKLGGGTTNFLRADGSWAVPPAAPPGDGTVSQAKLKSTTQSQSYDIDVGASRKFTLTGGQYCFRPTIKGESTVIRYPGASLTITTSYATVEILKNSGGTKQFGYVIHRYIQASGEVYWIFILRDKITKKSIGTSACADHPCFGQGGKPNLMPHPFLDDFDEAIHELIVINPTDEQVLEMQKKCPVESEDLPDRDLTEVIEDEYMIDDTAEPDWPSEPVTVKLPDDWEEAWLSQEEVTPIKKIIPQPSYIKTASLKLK